MAFFGFKKDKQADIPQRPQAISVSSLPFEAYKGSKPYIFISYAHADSVKVFPIIKEFHELGYNVWYDEGIEPGIAWPEEIGRALDGCGLFVVFITPRSVKSDNVDNEMYLALNKKKPFIAIYLEATKLTPGQELQFGKRQAILKYEMDNQSFQRKYTYSFEATSVKTDRLRQMPVPGDGDVTPTPKETPPPKPITPPEPMQTQTTVKAPEYQPNAERDVFTPKGTATISMIDGTQYTAIANTLMIYVIKGSYYVRFPYRRLDEKASLPGSSDEILAFEDLSSLSLSQPEGMAIALATCTDFDGETYVKEIIDKEGEFWCITGNGQNAMTKIPLANVSKIDFDYRCAPEYQIPMSLIERSASKSLLTPRASLIAEYRISNLGRAPTYCFVDLIPLETSGETPYKRLRTLRVDKVIKEASMFSPIVEADITILKKNGETVTDKLNACYSFYALNSNDIVKPNMSSITGITFDYTGS